MIARLWSADTTPAQAPAYAEHLRTHVLPALNAIFSQYFPVDPPARTTFQCSRLVNDAHVEIEAVAMR